MIPRDEIILAIIASLAGDAGYKPDGREHLVRVRGAEMRTTLAGARDQQHIYDLRDRGLIERTEAGGWRPTAEGAALAQEMDP